MASNVTAKDDIYL